MAPSPHRTSARLNVAAPTHILAADPTVGKSAHATSSDNRAVIEHAIAQAECFPDRYESAVWFTMMEPRLVKRVPDKAERLEILRTVFCEAHRKGEMRLPPGLVMAVIDIESRFNRWAVSYAGAVGLMQIMPFWPEKLGMQRHQLTQIGPNVRMGCAILRYYIKYESNNVQKALARYNGSVGRRDYSDLVIGSWSRWNGADDPGFPGGCRSTCAKALRALIRRKLEIDHLD